MHRIRRGLATGIVGGVVGLAVMALIRRLVTTTRSERARRPTDVFVTERSISLIGTHHEPEETPTAAVGRLAYQKLAGHPPSPKTKAVLAWTVHVGYGLLVSSGFGVIQGKRDSQVIRDGLVFGTALWLLGAELAVPLLGLADKPTSYSPTHHVESLAEHLGFGIATAMTTRTLEVFR